jgi:integrase
LRTNSDSQRRCRSPSPCGEIHVGAWHDDLRLRRNASRDQDRQTSGGNLQMIAAVSRIYHPSRERLFPWPYSRTALNNQARAIFERALGQLPRGPGSLFHAIRRTAATAAAQRYGDGAARLLLMHTTSKTTREHYIDASKIIRQPPVLPQLTEVRGRQLEFFTS